MMSIKMMIVNIRMVVITINNCSINTDSHTKSNSNQTYMNDKNDIDKTITIITAI